MDSSLNVTLPLTLISSPISGTVSLSDLTVSPTCLINLRQHQILCQPLSWWFDVVANTYTGLRLYVLVKSAAQRIYSSILDCVFRPRAFLIMLALSIERKFQTVNHNSERTGGAYRPKVKRSCVHAFALSMEQNWHRRFCWRCSQPTSVQRRRAYAQLMRMGMVLYMSCYYEKPCIHNHSENTREN